MNKASLQLNQLFSDPALAQSLRGGSALFGKLMANGQKGADKSAAFEGLVSGLLLGRKNSLLDATPQTMHSAEITGDDILKGLPQEILALIQANTAAKKSGDTTDGILDALSATPADTKSSGLFTMVDDPELAAALAGLAAQIRAFENGGDVNALPAALQAKLNVNANASSFATALEKLRAYADAMQKDGTLTIADMDADTFQAFKKLAFADIAPYLTQPRNVVVDGRGVMKVAQGPAFLNEGETDITTLALNAGMAANITIPPQAQPQAANTAAAPATDTVPELPASMSQLVAGAAGNHAQNAKGKNGQATGTGKGEAAPDTNSKNPDALLQQNAGTKATPQVQAQATAALAGTAQRAQTPSTSESRGFSDIAMAAGAVAENSFTLNTSPEAAASALKGASDPAAPQNAANTLTAPRVAGQPHPGTHLVSVSIQRNLNPQTPGTERQFTIQMHPETLGRVNVTLQFGDNKTVKAHLVAERPETLALLQKDIGLLERTLNGSGLDTSSADSFTFDLAQGDSFAGSMQDGSNEQQGSAHKNAAADEFGTLPANTETVMPIYVDPQTGLTHVNIVI